MHDARVVDGTERRKHLARQLGIIVASVLYYLFVRPGDAAEVELPAPASAK